MTEDKSEIQLTPELPTNQKPVGAVVAAVKVLRYLSDSGGPAGVSQIAKECDLYPSTCFNILRTLVHDDLVHFDSTAKTYALGLGIIDFARGLVSQSGFIPTIQAELHESAQQGGFSMTLWRHVESRYNVVVASAPSGRVVQIHIGIGQRLPVYIGATGRIVAAFEELPRRELQKEFKRLHWDAAPTFKGYLEEVEQAREQGYALDIGAYRAGLVTIAAPVLDASGHVRMMVAAHTFQGEFSEPAQRKIAERLKVISARVQKAGSLSDYDN